MKTVADFKPTTLTQNSFVDSCTISGQASDQLDGFCMRGGLRQGLSLSKGGGCKARQESSQDGQKCADFSSTFL